MMISVNFLVLFDPNCTKVSLGIVSVNSRLTSSNYGRQIKFRINGFTRCLVPCLKSLTDYS